LPSKGTLNLYHKEGFVNFFLWGADRLFERTIPAKKGDWPFPLRVVYK
jgi:hypothetical protein